MREIFLIPTIDSFQIFVDLVNISRFSSISLTQETQAVRFLSKKNDCFLLLSSAFGTGLWDFTEFHLVVDGLPSINMELFCSGLRERSGDQKK